VEYRIIWVHGIGVHHPGYSQDWQNKFNRYLDLKPESYLEVCWDSVFDSKGIPARTAGPLEESRLKSYPLSPREDLEAREVQDQLATILLARSQALETAKSRKPARPRGAKSVPPGLPRPIEWSEIGTEFAGTKGFLPDWLTNPDAYLGDFAKYLISRGLRNAIKEKFKEVMRPLADSEFKIDVVAHSWGTVVAYDSLLDLQTELPGLRLANLFTLGSPLWAVRPFLEDRSGRKASEVANWVNIHAVGDLVGSWLSRGFRVDKEFEVQSIGSDAHDSYFNSENEVVQKDIVAHFILA
jgi:metacaspase-1